MLIEHRLGGEVVDKVADAIAVIQQYEPPEGYYVAFSGGKDSIVCLDLVKRSGVKWDAHYMRAMEPPEVVQFIKREYPEVQRHLPKKTMWQLIRDNGIPPLRTVRFCCGDLKEKAGRGRIVITGVRREESFGRRNYQIYGKSRGSGTLTLAPIVYWSSDEVWAYIRASNLAYPVLYNEGFSRIGCVMCPCGGSKKMQRDALRWPRIAEAYKRACRRAFDPDIGKSWTSGDDMYEWWISGKGFDGGDRLF